MGHIARVAVYCGSSPGFRAVFADAARDFGRALARRGMHLVYGGGKVGLMGVIADSVLASGGEVDGVIPDFLKAKELGHDGLTRLSVVSTMHERKAKMAALADAFVALPGGIGTWEEIVEMTTWTQLRLHDKPVALLDVDGYYAGLRTMIERAVDEGFMRPEHKDGILIERDPDCLLDALVGWRPHAVEKWVGVKPLGPERG
ncbi:MAG: TIGR00730 family Rossman fold protein [Polyangiaceae bacterium]